MFIRAAEQYLHERAERVRTRAPERVELDHPVHHDERHVGAGADKRLGDGRAEARDHVLDARRAHLFLVVEPQLAGPVDESRLREPPLRVDPHRQQHRLPAHAASH